MLSSSVHCVECKTDAREPGVRCTTRVAGLLWRVHAARKFETLLVGDGCGDVLYVPVAVSGVRVSWSLPGISVWTCALNQDWPAY